MSAPRGTGMNASRLAQRAKVKSAAEVYAADLAAGEVPSLRRIRADFHVGQPKSQETRVDLRAALAAKPSGPPQWRLAGMPSLGRLIRYQIYLGHSRRPM